MHPRILVKSWHSCLLVALVLLLIGCNDDRARVEELEARNKAPETQIVELKTEPEEPEEVGNPTEPSRTTEAGRHCSLQKDSWCRTARVGLDVAWHAGPAKYGRSLNQYGSLEHTIHTLRAHRLLDLNAEAWRKVNPGRNYQELAQ